MAKTSKRERKDISPRSAFDYISNFTPSAKLDASNTQETKIHDRAKVKKRVKDSRKKKVKAAKKNPQWKSKHPKDPGIPNDFPYKDQILAEVAEQRRQDAAEKEKKKADKRLAKAQTKGGLDEDTAEPDHEPQEDDTSETNKTGKNKLDVGAESIANLSAKLIHAQLKPRPQPVVVEDIEEEEEVPTLVNRDLPTLRSVLDAADVVLEVVDARDPLESRSAYLEKLVKDEGKKLLVVLNKIDTCPREAVSSWASHLRSEQPTLLFRSSTAFLPSGPELTKGKGKSKAPVGDAMGLDSVLSCLGQWAQEKMADEALAVAVVGVTNVGKSSLINSLSKRSALPVYSLSSSSRGPSTTELPQEVTFEVNGRQIRLIDTPGLSFGFDITDDNYDYIRGRDILLRNKGRIDKLKDSTLPIGNIIARANTEDLMLLYNLPAFSKGELTAFLSGVARSNQLIRKKGELDLTTAARVVLRDWSTGKFARYASPAPSKSTVSSSENTLSSDDEAILAQLKPRKEMRRSIGLVRFSTGMIDARGVNLDEPWAALDESDNDEADDGDGDEEGMEDEEGGSKDEDDDSEDDDVDMDEDVELGDSDDEEENDDEEEISSPPPISSKQKRKRVPDTVPLSRPSKKVAFAAIPNSKQLVSPKKKQSPILSSKAHGAQSRSKDKAPKNIKTSITSLKKPERKVANVATKKGKVAAANGAEAYDFNKFF